MVLAGCGAITDGDYGDIKGNYDTMQTHIISANAVDVFGSWVQLLADVGSRGIYIQHIQVWTDEASVNADINIEIEVGVGAAASEAREFGIYPHIVGGSTTSGGGMPGPISIGRRIEPSARLSARARDSTTGTYEYILSITYKDL